LEYGENSLKPTLVEMLEQTILDGFEKLKLVSGKIIDISTKMIFFSS